MSSFREYFSIFVIIDSYNKSFKDSDIHYRAPIGGLPNDHFEQHLYMYSNPSHNH